MPILADAERQRPGPEAAGVAEDLRRRVEGEVLFDSLHRTLYGRGACIYEVLPAAAVGARHEGDVLAVLEYARQNRIPITARGGGSGLAGQTLGRGIILDFSKYFQRIADIDATRGTVRVQPGVIQAQLNRVLRRHGMRFAPDPSAAPWCTLGGMLANNAGGSHTIRHGATRENTLSLRAALADGTVIDTSPLPLPGQGTWTPGPQARLASGLLEIVTRHREVIDRRSPKTRRNSSGYALREAVDGRIDLAQILAGSEGTLGLILDATLRIVPIPKARARSEEHTSELQSRLHLVCRLLLEKKK